MASSPSMRRGSRGEQRSGAGGTLRKGEGSGPSRPAGAHGDLLGARVAQSSPWGRVPGALEPEPVQSFWVGLGTAGGHSAHGHWPCLLTSGAAGLLVCVPMHALRSPEPADPCPAGPAPPTPALLTTAPLTLALLSPALLAQPCQPWPC